MTGPEHFAEAERLLKRSDEASIDDGHARLLATQAQVHATLALTALSASDRYVGNAGQAAEWVRVLHPPAPDDEPTSE